MKKFISVLIVILIIACVLSLFTGSVSAHAKLPEKKDPAIVFTPDGYVIMPKEYFDNFLKKRAKEDEIRQQMEDYIIELEEGKCS